MKKNDMYYDRLLPLHSAKLIMPDAQFYWLINFVKSHPDLDFQTGKNKNESWISIYRGTTSLLKIKGQKKGFKVIVDKKYRNLCPELYNQPSPENFEKLLLNIGTYKNEKGINTLANYYDNNKEGYFQNLISRRYGIEGRRDDSLVIVDKEVVIGYINKIIRKEILDSIRIKYQPALDELQKLKGFPTKLNEFTFGNEFDFLALDSEGQIILMELKDGSDTQKIYLSPFQISTYCDIYNKYVFQNKDEFERVVFDMIKQKQELGLLNPKWVIPTTIVGMKAALVIGGKFSKTVNINYNQVIKVVNNYNIETFECDNNGELVEIKL